MRSAVPQKFRSGKAARNSVANFFPASRPRRGAGIEYSKRMSGAASSSTTAGFHGFPQNSVNQRPTIALFSSDMVVSFRNVRNPSTVTKGSSGPLPPVPIGRSPVGVFNPHPVDAGVSENVRWNSWMMSRGRHSRPKDHCLKGRWLGPADLNQGQSLKGRMRQPASNDQGGTMSDGEAMLWLAHVSN